MYGRRQLAGLISTSDSQSSGPGFYPHSDHYLDLFEFTVAPKFAFLATYALKKEANWFASGRLEFLRMLCSS